MESVKYTVIGTPRCGKTSLIHRYLYSEWLQEERHTTAELYSLPISRVCVVGIWDTGGDALQHRKAISPETNIFLICFKADDDTAAVTKYYEEIAPIVHKGARAMFVQCGVDRELEQVADLTALQQLARVTKCSARTGEGVELLFKAAALLVLAPRFSERRAKFSFEDTSIDAKHVVVRKEWPDLSSLKDYCRSDFCTSCSERIEPGEHMNRCHERDCDKTYHVCDTCQTKFGKKHHHTTYREQLHLQVDVAWRVRYPTMCQTLLAALTLFGNRPCLGRWRGDWAWLTGADLLQEVLKIAAGLSVLLSRRDHVAVCSKPKIEWLLADMSILVSNFVAVPIHHVISDEDLQFITHHAEVTAVFCSADLIPRFMTAAGTSPGLKHVICLEDLAHEDRTELKIAPNVSLYDLQDIMLLGAHIDTVPLANSEASDLCSIGYTSGSTGRPKGAMLDQGTMMRECAYSTPLFETLVELCWEPLSHSQRTNTYNVMLAGGRSGVFEQEFSMEVFNCLRSLKPNVIVGSPRLWNFVYHEYERTLNVLRGEGAVQSRDVDGAHSTTLRTGDTTFVLENQRGTETREIEDSLIELFYAQYFGGRAVGLVTGGAPTSDKVMAWMRKFASCGATVFNSYGITEVGGIAVNEYIKDNVECKLVDVPELGYFSTDRPYPRGEIVVRTNTMSLGYYKDENTTANSFMNGWFHTGDIGQIEGPKVIKIIDRKKNIVKLSQGEFVSLNEMELVYFKSTFVNQVCIHGDSQFPFLVAIVVPNLTALNEHFGVDLNGTDLPNLESYCDRAEVKELIWNDFRYLATLNKLRSFERIKHVILTPVKWSSANGLLTATDKINRRAIVAKFSAQLAALFTEHEPEHVINSSDALSVQIRQVIESQVGARVSGTVPVSAVLVDSIATIELVNTLALQFNVPLDHKCAIDLLVNHTMDECVARFSEIIAALHQRRGSASHVINTSAELTQLVGEDTALLNKAISWLKDRAESRTAASTSGTVTVLLTGVTGFLGAFLLAELYRCVPKNAQIICLIRKKSSPPQQAVSATLRKYEIDSDLVREIENSPRITWLEGDLNLANFGLAEERFHELAVQTDHVIHNAAWVNGLWPYKSLRAVNVHATIDVLKYSVLSRGKNLHYISTASTLADQSQLWSRDGGYPLTKFVAEEFVRTTVEQFPNFAATIYRPGSISGDTVNGAVNMEAYINKLMAGLVQLGTFPNLSSTLNWIPCDIVAKNVIQQSLQNIHQGNRLRAINLVNSSVMKWQELTTYLAQSSIFGNRKPKIVRFSEWREELEANRAHNALGPLMAYFSEGVPSDDPVECTNLAVACPSMSRDLIEKYLQYMARHGYI
jgi:fatty acid CoA ligase FadD9